MRYRGILPIFIALIIAGSVSLTSGGYVGVRYYKSVKYQKQADQFFASGQYAEAQKLYEKSLTYWKKPAVENRKNESEREMDYSKQVADAQLALNESNWQGCIDNLGNIASGSRVFGSAENLRNECQSWLDKYAPKPAEEAPAPVEDANKKQVASSGAASKPKSSSAAQSGSSNSSSTSSSDPTPSTSSGESQSTSSSCTSDTSPTFTSNVTDLSQVDDIAVPPRIIGGDLKGHSYINSNHRRVPVYAPADIKLLGGIHLSHGSDPNDFGMDFQVSCEVKIRVGHITEPVQSIKDLLGDATADSRNQKTFNPPTLSFSAGDLIGYTTGTAAAGNWDFGTYNSSTSNKYATDPAWNWSSYYTTAVCPYDYFSAGLKPSYVAKYIQDFGVSTHDSDFFCK